MKKGVLVTLTGSIFAVAGFVAGWFASKYKYKKQASIEIESIKKSQDAHEEWLLKFYGVDKAKIKLEGEKTTTPKLMQEENKDTGSDVRLDGRKIKYHNQLPEEPLPPTKEEVEEYHNKVNHYNETQTGDKLLPVRLISEQEYEESSNTYQQLYYYNDGVIADTDNNRVNNFVKLIGPMELWSKKFDRRLKKPVVYVRNEETEIDYEILYCDQAWEDVATPSQKAAALHELDESADED